MAKKKKASAKHAKKTSAAPSSPSSSRKKPFPTMWVVGAIIVVVVLLLLFKGRKAPEMPEPAAPIEPVPADEEPFDEDEGVLVPSEVEIVKETTGTRSGAYDPMVWETGSFFGGIKCLKSTGFRTDVLEFQLKNKESFPIHIESVTPGDTTKNPTSFSINGHSFKAKGVQEGCGTGVVEPGQTVTCTFEAPLRHYGPTGAKSENTLQLKIRTATKKVTSQTNFFC